MASQLHRVILGTAGHIDHGKSSLVRALTGIDPDRLKEEQERGMTIDLGFAPYKTASGRLVGMIDVPGHEKFVKNMVAGAASVDVFLLVIAADDGVMPQTREHVEILELLGVRRGAVVVTKVDMVDASLRELAFADIAEYLATTVFAQAPVVPVSSVTGEGLDVLRGVIDRLVEEVVPRSKDGLFRMPIQRVFSAKGHGTVVTGVPISGEAHVGDVLEILPAQVRGKVRGLQAYKEDRDDAAAGHSSALNLSDVDYRTVARGHVVVTPGYFTASRSFDVEVRLLASVERPLRHGTEVRVHTGTAEIIGRVVLLEQPTLQPGASALAQLRLREPVVAIRGDRFLLRRVSPATTIAGGTILGESRTRAGGRRLDVARSVRRKAEAVTDLPAFLESVLLERATHRPLPEKEVPVALRCDDAAAAAALATLERRNVVRRVGRGGLVHAQTLAVAQAAVRAALTRFHADQPLKALADALPLRAELRLDEAVFDGACEAMVAAGELVLEKGGKLRLKAAGPTLSDSDRKALAGLSAAVGSGGLAPPALPDLARTCGVPEVRAKALLTLLVESGDAHRVGEFWFSRDAIERALECVRASAAESQGEILIPSVRDRLQTTRKYLIPLLEWFDARGWSVRRGERRYVVLKPTERKA
ncbi:MAG: selenocysteine-specific translation elongation factor [Planctomycetes bacterium]|nr:selenocysteine-specific translation elongation factor [Planctomycetota bacterium]MCC7170277.1 selenocysteine-specific translation elongation factor [Planctomycetota bacterium]